MIKSESIDQLKSQLDIVEVVRHYVDLKKKGSTWMACCPFHEERSPSFSVNDKEGYYKCFGCDAKGDAIKFVMEHESLEFADAIKELAKLYNFTLEFTKEKQDPIRGKKEKALELTQGALSIYNKKLAKDKKAQEYLQGRGLSGEDCVTWDIGFVPKEFDNVKKFAIEKGLMDVGIDIGIINEKGEKIYDMFVNRITIGVRNKQGHLIGFGARAFGENDVKYINSKSSYIYDKSANLYGIDKAYKSINKFKTAVVVEGYFDVISAHKAGLDVTVGVNSKSVSEQQARQLAKMCETVILAFDNELKTIDDMIKGYRLLIAAGCDDVYIYQYPDGVNDFDDCAKAGYLDKPLGEIRKDDCKAAFSWMVEILKKRAGKDFKAVEGAIDAVCDVIALHASEFYQGKLVDMAQQIMKEPKKVFKDKLSLARMAVSGQGDAQSAAGEIPEDAQFRLPKGVDTQFFMEHGYYGLQNGLDSGYYFNQGKSDKPQRISNFVMTPLFHLYSLNSEENKRIVSVHNGFGERQKIMEIRSDDMVSADKLKNVMAREGNYLFYGATPQLMRINTVIMQKFPKCWELSTLGWQKEGFFAFANKVYHNDNLVDYDKMGIVKIDDVYYYSPSCSDIYKDIRSDSDAYKNDREINFCPSPIELTQWMSLLQNVYGNHARLGIAYCLLTAFRDIIFSIDNNCPHLYAYGQSQSGKSKFIDSLCAMFYKRINAYNLNSGTNASFSAHMSRYSNCPAPFNELEEKTIKEDWFQVLKTAYDGEGRKRMDMTMKGKIEEQEIKSTIMLIGQYLCTKDDNSLLSRSIILPFHKKKHTTDGMEDYTKLKNFEEQGMNELLIEVLKLRKHFEEDYYQYFHDGFKMVRSQLQKNEVNFNERVARNYTALFACAKLAADNGMVLPFTSEEFLEDILGDIQKLSDLLTNSDSTATFWQRLEEMLAEGEITEGVDFRIITYAEKTIKVTNDGKEKEIFIDGSRRFIAMRLKQKIHSKYLQKCKQVGGEAGLPYQTLLLYLKKSDYWIGEKKSVRFDNVAKNAYEPYKTKKVQSISNAYLLDYDLLHSRGIDLDYFSDDDTFAEDPEDDEPRETPF